MDLSQLFVSLPRALQFKIRIYYLSYGTNTCSVIKQVLHNNQYLCDNPEMTLWNFFVYNHGYVRCKDLYKHPILSVSHELELARISTSGMDDYLKQYLEQHTMHMIESLFIRKYESLL